MIYSVKMLDNGIILFNIGLRNRNLNQTYIVGFLAINVMSYTFTVG